MQFRRSFQYVLSDIIKMGLRSKCPVVMVEIKQQNNKMCSAQIIAWQCLWPKTILYCYTINNIIIIVVATSVCMSSLYDFQVVYSPGALLFLNHGLSFLFYFLFARVSNNIIIISTHILT